MNENINGNALRHRKIQNFPDDLDDLNQFNDIYGDNLDNYDDGNFKDAIDKNMLPHEQEKLSDADNLKYNLKQQWQFIAFVFALCISMYYLTIYNERQLVKIKEEYAANIKPERYWWQNAFIYTVDIRTFQDSNFDGIGDILGILSRNENFESLAVDAVMLDNLFYHSETEFVIDFLKIHPQYGNIEDFKRLIRTFKDKNIKTLIKLKLNQVHINSDWFLKSEKCDECIENDYFIWTDCSKNVPPNNWKNVYGSSIWQYNKIKKKCFLSQHGLDSIDLNFRNTDLILFFKNVFRYWLTIGVDGFVIDDLDLILEEIDLSTNEDFEEFIDGIEDGEQIIIQSSDTKLTRFHHEMHDVLAIWKEVFDDHQLKNNFHPFLSCQFYEIFENTEAARYYDTGIDAPVKSINFRSNCDGICVFEKIDSWISEIPSNSAPAWMISHSHTNYKQYIMLIMTLPGTAFIKYGNEFKKVQNSSEIKFINQQSQEYNDRMDSFASLSNIRKEQAFLNGKLNFAITSKQIFSYIRYAKRFPPYLIVLNLGNTEITIDFTESCNYSIGEVMVVFGDNNVNKLYDKISLKNVRLSSEECLILRLLPGKI